MCFGHIARSTSAGLNPATVTFFVTKKMAVATTVSQRGMLFKMEVFHERREEVIVRHPPARISLADALRIACDRRPRCPSLASR
jgi:hypothetical protein